MNLCDCCKSWETCALVWRDKVNFPGDHCTGLALITRSDLAARDAEIARVREEVELLRLLRDRVLDTAPAGECRSIARDAVKHAAEGAKP